MVDIASLMCLRLGKYEDSSHSVVVGRHGGLYKEKRKKAPILRFDDLLAGEPVSF